MGKEKKVILGSFEFGW